MNKTKCLFALLISAVLLAGCATGPIEPAKKAGVKTVKIEPRVDSEAMRFGQVQQGTLTAALTALTLDALKSKQLTEMTALMHDNGIDIPQMVRERFAVALKNNSDLQVDEAKAEGTFILRLQQHGFDDLGFSLTKKVPFVVLAAELQDGTGKRLWRGMGNNVAMRSKDVGATWSEYRADPALLKRDWETQIDAALGVLLRLK